MTPTAKPETLNTVGGLRACALQPGKLGGGGVQGLGFGGLKARGPESELSVGFFWLYGLGFKRFTGIQLRGQQASPGRRCLTLHAKTLSFRLKALTFQSLNFPPKAPSLKP